MTHMKTMVLATRNAGKKLEIEQLLAQYGYVVTFLPDYPEAPHVDEDRPTLEGNAEKKARSIVDVLGLPALADDTGLEVAGLDGAPGVRSARYAGEESNANANKELLLHNMQGMADRSARFRTVLAYIRDEDVHLFEGVCAGSIAEEERGEGGFGYDSLFVPEGHTKTFAEMATEEKNKISHRGRALQKFVDFLAA